MQTLNTLDWIPSPEETEKLRIREQEIKAKLFAHDLAYQYFDPEHCKEGELIHEYVDGKKELWDFSGNRKYCLIKVIYSPLL